MNILVSIQFCQISFAISQYTSRFHNIHPLLLHKAAVPRGSEIKYSAIEFWIRILIQITIYRRLRKGQDGHLDPSEAYDIS